MRVVVRRFEVQPRTAKERHHNLRVRAAHLLSADDGVKRAGKARGVACPQRPRPRLGGLPKRAVHDGRNPAQPAALCQQATLEPRRACVPVQVHERHATELHKVLLRAHEARAGAATAVQDGERAPQREQSGQVPVRQLERRAWLERGLRCWLGARGSGQGLGWGVGAEGWELGAQGCVGAGKARGYKGEARGERRGARGDGRGARGAPRRGAKV